MQPALSPPVFPLGKDRANFPQSIAERGEGTKRSLMHKARRSHALAGLFHAFTNKGKYCGTQGKLGFPFLTSASINAGGNPCN